MQEAEFLSEPGLIHLNTGTFGLMPRHVRERMAWATWTHASTSRADPNAV